jgi:hypothetical protein
MKSQDLAARHQPILLLLAALAMVTTMNLSNENSLMAILLILVTP